MLVSFFVFMRKRGQSQLEYIILFILILGAIIPLFYFSSNSLGEVYRTNQVEDTVKSIALTGNSVNNLGEGNSETIIVSIPQGVNEAYIENNSIVYVLGDKEIKESTNEDFFGVLPKTAGIYNLQVEAIGNGVVKLGDVPYIVSIKPSSIHIPSWKKDEKVSIIGKDFDNFSKLYYAFTDEPEILYLMPKRYYSQVSPSTISLNPKSLFKKAKKEAYFDILIKDENEFFSNRKVLHVYKKKIKGRAGNDFVV
jgi:hypothetical protein